MVGRIELQAGPVIWRKRVVPHLGDRYVEITINDETSRLPLPENPVLWDEFHPQLYRYSVDYHGMPVEVTFGLRDIRVEGSQLLLNGKPLFLRGTVENCCFPETGYPPTDEEAWTAIFRKCKDYGLNHIRFHSYCPPDAAFTAADKLGLYLQPEGPSWPNHGVRLRQGQVIDQYLLEESKRIIDTYGHHPSFIMMAAGNEPAGDWVNYCNDWVKEMKRYDPSRLYCGASVGGGWAWDDGSEYHVKGGARGLDMRLGYVGPIGTLVWAVGPVVNQEGLRFAAETDHYSYGFDQILAQTGATVYGITDSTNAMREGLFALSYMERELIPEEKQAKFLEVLDRVMLENPGNWEVYYKGSEEEKAQKRKFSLSDRCRYYFAHPDVQAAIVKLCENLDSVHIPLGLLHQFMPTQYIKVRDGRLPLKAYELAKDKVTEAVEEYNYATKYNYMISSVFVG